jgi:PTH2 family peptidyl-tRNA hydrolase
METIVLTMMVRVCYNEDMRPVMYIFINRELNMSVGKAGAQAAHAACNAMRRSDPKMVEAWFLGGHYTKLVMEAADAATLDTYERYINDRGFRTELIIDEGRTEIPPMSKTALGVEIVDKSDEHVLATFGEFKLYPKTPEPRPLNVEGAYNYIAACRHLNRAGKLVQKNGNFYE